MILVDPCNDGRFYKAYIFTGVDELEIIHHDGRLLTRS